MTDIWQPRLPIIPMVKGPADAKSLLERARRRDGGVRSPDGELYELPSGLDALISADPWRARLTSWALHAISAPIEAWIFHGGEPTADPIEHRPHVVVVRSHTDAAPRALEVGCRRVDGRMRVQTWYPVAHPLPVFEGYWSEAMRFWPRVLGLHVHEDRERDVLVLAPDPPEPWEGHWIPAPTGLFMMERAGLPVPIWIGMEIHEFRAAWTLLVAHPPLAGLLSSAVSIDGGPPGSLADQLTRMIEHQGRESVD